MIALRNDTDDIVERVRSLAMSYGISPYSVASFIVDELKITDPALNSGLAGCLSIICIIECLDYDKKDFNDYLENSIESLGHSAVERIHFIESKLSMSRDEKSFSLWRNNQAGFAIGITLSLAANKNYNAVMLNEIFNDSLASFVTILPNQKINQIIGLSAHNQQL